MDSLHQRRLLADPNLTPRALAEISLDDIRLASAAIGADGEKHHEPGRDLLERLSGAARADAASASLLRVVHKRASTDRP